MGEPGARGCLQRRRRHPPEHRAVLLRRAPLQRERRRRARPTRPSLGPDPSLPRREPQPWALPPPPGPPVHTQPSARQPPSSPAQTSIASVTLREEAAQARTAQPLASSVPTPSCSFSRPALTKRCRRVPSSRGIGPSRLGADKRGPSLPPWPRRKGRWKGRRKGRAGAVAPAQGRARYLRYGEPGREACRG